MARLQGTLCALVTAIAWAASSTASAADSDARASSTPKPSPTGAAPTRARSASPARSERSARAATLGAAQARYLALAKAGVARAKRRFSDRRRGWYDAHLSDRDRYPLATIWDIVPLFRAIDAIAIAQPTPANRRAVRAFACCPGTARRSHPPTRGR
jgi:hypothetical protein